MLRCAAPTGPADRVGYLCAMPERARKVDLPIGPPERLTPSRRARFDRLDALRGAAMLWMTGFHACFDLNLQGLIGRQNFYQDPFWTVQRMLILSLFLACAGAGQAVAQRQGVPWPRFWRRWSQVLLCAAAVSLGSWWMFGPRWISFGVLHALALMTLLARLLAVRGAPWLIALALACLLLPLGWSHEVFDSRWTDWIGLVTHKPPTEDYVPLLPWFGVLLGGLLAMHQALRRWPAVVSGALPRPLRPLALLGRWSLTYYMLHQPVLLGLIGAWVALRS
jgi:uncharacterized membrane protein